MSLTHLEIKSLYQEISGIVSEKLSNTTQLFKENQNKAPKASNCWWKFKLFLQLREQPEGIVKILNTHILSIIDKQERHSG